MCTGHAVRPILGCKGNFPLGFGSCVFTSSYFAGMPGPLKNLRLNYFRPLAQGLGTNDTLVVFLLCSRQTVQFLEDSDALLQLKPFGSASGCSHVFQWSVLHTG